MTWDEHEDMLDCQKVLLRALTREMDNRAKHRQNGADWVAKERLAIQQAAYDWAVRHKMTTRPTMYDIERLEPFAMGHVDYASKLCLYVAEFLYGQRGIPV